MESQVKSQLMNKTYTSSLEKIEEDDRDANSELYKIPVSGHNIMVAPGKSIMSDSGVAYCYVYVIQQEKVICKLGVYEKKTDTMPMFFDLSSFPEGSLLLFEEYEMNPSKLLDFEMKEKETITETNNVFDYLIRELFPKIKDKKKQLNDAYKLLFGIYSKDDQDKDMKPILKVISATRKIEPTEAFLQTLKENATDKTKFALTLLALQPFFNVDFQFKNDTEHIENFSHYEELKRRWKIVDSPKIIEVNIDTYEMIGERDKDLSVIPEETTIIETIPEKEPEPLEVVPKEPVETRIEEPALEPEPVPEPEPIEIEEPAPESESEKITRPAPVRRGRTPKSDVEVKSTVKKERKTTPKISKVPRGTSMNAVIEKPSISLNEEPGPSISLNEEPISEDTGTKKTKKKSTSSESVSVPEKIKIKRIPKLKTKSETPEE